MWALIFLYFMGLHTCQTTGQGNSTQMHYAKLTIERSAINNITNLLSPFPIASLNLQVSDLRMTTNCTNGTDPANRECTCTAGHKWSDRVCQSHDKCCDISTCTFSQNSAHMCVSKNTVSITGSVTITGTSHQGCLAKKETEEFKTCNNGLYEQLKKVYSTLSGFDVLKITKYSIGSIIIDFEMTIVSDVDPQDLINRSQELTNSLNAKLNLETTGVVLLKLPKQPVKYCSTQVLLCKTATPMSMTPVWQLKSQGEVHVITNGTEALIESDPTGSRLRLTGIKDVWAGEYICTYRQESPSYTISHIASAVMDICLQPEIAITTAPQFPHCKGDFVKVEGKCEIKMSSETYDVTWEDIGISASITPSGPYNSTETVFYKAETIIACNSSSEAPQLMCTFQNRCNQSKKAEITINIISADDKFCEPDGDWQAAKAGFTAVLKCENAVGQRRRKCIDTTPATWGEEESECVNWRVSRVLQSANIVDIGLGSLEENSARVFSHLDNVTNETDTINSFANLKTSVDVLLTLSEKVNPIDNGSTADNIFGSSSNLLEKSLQDSWKAKTNTGNLTLAETYLSSVERLIELTNVTQKEKKPNVEVAACQSKQGEKCINTVFNATVQLSDPDKGVVKTAGFQHLEKYLPHNNSETEINSIVVSTTVENKQGDVDIKINFELMRKRPRDVRIHCVSWDNTTRQWSAKGCEWKGGGLCSCNHLSSFAVLMAKEPLEIPGIEEITLVGLSVSVVSLILCLVIQVIVWRAVVKSDNLYLLHIVHVNISVCLLVGDCCFLASYKPPIPKIWCQTVVVLKHFSYLSMFFWMLCLSCALLHQTVFTLHKVSKKTYLKLSFFLGYICPSLIVIITFMCNEAGAEGVYYHEDTCWLVYVKAFQGSIHAFVIPVGIIVFVNVFSMLVVIMKLLTHTKKREMFNEKENAAVKTIIRTVIVLTPTFGVTWIFGFGVLLLDLTDGAIAFVVNYAFTLLNAFQGFFILLTTCLADRPTREALLSHFRKPTTVSISDVSTKVESIMKK